MAHKYQTVEHGTRKYQKNISYLKQHSSLGETVYRSEYREPGGTFDVGLRFWGGV